jgi:hypothetical protein
MSPMEYSGAREKLIHGKLLNLKISCQTLFKLCKKREELCEGLNTEETVLKLCFQGAHPHRENIDKRADVFIRYI